MPFAVYFIKIARVDKVAVFSVRSIIDLLYPKRIENYPHDRSLSRFELTQCQRTDGFTIASTVLTRCKNVKSHVFWILNKKKLKTFLA